MRNVNAVPDFRFFKLIHACQIFQYWRSMEHNPVIFTSSVAGVG
jgi:hypothetical protein